MGLWDKIKGEFIDIIQWLDDSDDTMVYRFERYGNEIKYGAKLVVRESQVAVFVNEGKIADIYNPGTYTLETKNMPIMTTLNSWSYGFNSPFKAEVYFVNMKTFTNNKWGTKNPIMLRDPEFGPVRLRAFGTYAIKVKDPAVVVRSVSGTNGKFDVEQISEQLRNMIVSRFTDIIGESKIPILDLASNYNELGDFIHDKINPEFETYGFEVVNMLVENISLPPEVEQALDKRSSMGIIGNLNAYTQFQSANAIEEAAKNPGGNAAGGMGMGMGFAMAQQMSNSMAQNNNMSSPPPMQHNASYYVNINDTQSGPFDTVALQGMVREGKLKGDTYVWKQGMSEWKPAKDVAEVSGLLGQVPPPMPKYNSAPSGPPPLPKPKEQVSYFVNIEGQQEGPFTIDQLTEMANDQRITRDTYVWKQGMDNWVPAYETPHLKDMFDFK